MINYVINSLHIKMVSTLLTHFLRMSLPQLTRAATNKYFHYSFVFPIISQINRLDWTSSCLQSSQITIIQLLSVLIQFLYFIWTIVSIHSLACHLQMTYQLTLNASWPRLLCVAWPVESNHSYRPMPLLCTVYLKSLS